MRADTPRRKGQCHEPTSRTRQNSVVRRSVSSAPPANRSLPLPVNKEVSHETLRAWVKQADIDAGLRHDGLTTEETAAVRQLRREVKRLREELRDPVKSRRLLRQGDGADPQVRFAFIEREKAHYAVALLCQVLTVCSQRILCLAQTSTIRPSVCECRVDRADQGDSCHEPANVRRATDSRRACRGKEVRCGL